MITAIFIYAEDCGNCPQFKIRHAPMIKSIMDKYGINSIERKVKNYSIGFPSNYDDPSILTQITAYPSLLLVNTQLMNSNKPLKEILKEVHVLNGVVNTSLDKNMIQPVRGQYSLSPTDIKRFVDDYFSKYVNLKVEPCIPVKMSAKHRQGYSMLEKVSPINRDKRF